MGLFTKIFGKDKSGQQSSQFQDSESTTEQNASKNAPRREMVHVVLRDTLRSHGIPSDWMDCRILPITSRSGASGMHVQLIVRDGHDRLLAYVPAFQESFTNAIEKFDARADDWLLSLSWQFDGMPAGQRVMPDPGTWAPMAPTPPPALAPADLSDFVSTQDDEVEEDLKALYAIRDAAMRQEPEPEPEPEQKDFQDTKPGA